ncbi:MAG: multicopper oxidase family protein [Sandaracinaceae bacterium]
MVFRKPLSRRGFLRIGAAGALVVGCGGGDDPDAGTDAGSDAGMADAGRDAGADAGRDAGTDGGPPLPTLAFPPLEEGTMTGGVRRFGLTMAAGTTQFFEGVDTTTAGYNGSFLGPALQMRRGESVEIAVENQLGRVTTTHWHGMHVPAAMDGGPHQPILDGETWTAAFTVDNAASLCWYHPHAMGDPSQPQATSAQVWTGLAGLIWVRDDESDALALPSTYGVDDLPLVLMDREFTDAGQLAPLAVPSDAMGVRKGGVFLVNGVPSPRHETHAQRIRVRVLNGSNARIYNLALIDAAGEDREFQVIGSDGGLLERPVPLRRLVLSPGERAELVFDFAADERQSLRLVSKNLELSNSLYAGNFIADAYDDLENRLVTFEVGAATDNPIQTLPSALATLETFEESAAARTRQFDLNVPNGEGLHPINGMAMDISRTDFSVPLDDIEIWEIRNLTQMAHPFHIHGEPFRVLSRTGLAMDGVPEEETGLKDTTLVRSGEVVRVIRPFRDFADADGHFMYHCHILEHEDRGMMGQFTVA